MENNHYLEIERRLGGIIHVAAADEGSPSCAHTSINIEEDDGVGADQALADINAALAPDYVAEWTGNGNGAEADVAITLRPKVVSWRAIIGQWPTQKWLAADIDVSSDEVSKWKLSRGVPEKYWPALLDSAARRGIGLSESDLWQARKERKQSNPDRQSSI